MNEPVGLNHFLLFGAVLFVCGVLCMALKRNAIGVLMGVELVLNGANVNFVKAAGSGRIEVRTYERGVEGETLSCGSGVVAAAIAAGRQGVAASPVACGTRSGVDLTVEFRDEGEAFTHVRLTGDAREVYGAELTEEAWKE